MKMSRLMKMFFTLIIVLADIIILGALAGDYFIIALLLVLSISFGILGGIWSIPEPPEDM